MEARIGRHQPLRGNADPKIQLQPGATTSACPSLAGLRARGGLRALAGLGIPVSAQPGERLLAYTPDRMPELNILRDLGPGHVETPDTLKHVLCVARPQRVDFLRGESGRCRLDLDRLANAVQERAWRDLLIRLAH